ncbi:translocon-associated protein subunit alpha [Galendromus occidentalis]|uniref:Translocon-associated protein subunit alpha n=1 Tax=Galendromus occidentalis TaxID=34638 RepID=A0AAJ6VW94_9ACAR|nr:translocon-associated protein subunit alpha [Galendromus occidentalis]
MKIFAVVFTSLLLVGVSLAEDDEATEQVETIEDLIPEGTGYEKHPGADTHILFTKPGGGYRLVSGQEAHILLGFINRASEDLFIDTLDASFRLAGDYNSVIQNLSAVGYNRKLSTGQEASLFYQFHVDNVFSGMPVGLEVSLMYHDSEGKVYREAVFNSTLTVEEPEVSFDAETFFLYVFLAAAIVLGAVLLLQCVSRNKKPSGRTETGTKDGDVDYAWLPSTVLKQGTPKSTRQKKNKSE